MALQVTLPLSLPCQMPIPIVAAAPSIPKTMTRMSWRSRVLVFLDVDVDVGTERFEGLVVGEAGESV